MDPLFATISAKLIEQGPIAIALVVVSVLYYRSQAELKALNTLLVDHMKTESKAVTQALTENSAVQAARVAASDRDAEASRDLSEAIRGLAEASRSHGETIRGQGEIIRALAQRRTD